MVIGPHTRRPWRLRLAAVALIVIVGLAVEHVQVRQRSNQVDVAEAAFALAGNRNFYSLAVDPQDNAVLATDAGNYLQKGYVYRYKPNGTIIDSLAAGIIPGFIGFN